MSRLQHSQHLHPQSLPPRAKQVLDIARQEEVCRRLMSVPGVGPITALAFRATMTIRIASSGPGTWARISA